MPQLIPQPDPEYAQKALAEVREQQRLVVEKAKLTGLNVLTEMIQWTADVAAGKKKVVEYTMKGEPYEVDPMKYLFESGDKLKALAATVETLGGKQESRNQVHLAILGRSKEAPRKLTKEEAREIQVIEITEE